MADLPFTDPSGLEDALESCAPDCVPPSTPDLTLPQPVADTPAIHGGVEDQYWQQQSENGLCAPMSTVILLNEFGIQVTEAEVAAVAARNGWLDGQPGNWQGMTVDETEQLIEAYGVPAHVENGTLDTLAQYLDENRGVIIAVDSDEVWDRIGDDQDPADKGMDHALVVTAIDEQRGIVRLNDPGNPEGMGYELSLDQFVDAWGDSDNAMVVTDVAPEGAGGGPVQLPVTLEPGCGCEPVLEPVEPSAGSPATNPIISLVESSEQSFLDVAVDVWGHVTGGQPVPTSPIGVPLSAEQLLVETMKHTTDPATLMFLQQALEHHRAAVDAWV